jgi:hypothetical protein
MPTLTPHEPDDCDAVTVQLIEMCRTAIACDDLALADSLLSGIASRVATIMLERHPAPPPLSRIWATSAVEPGEAVAR